ncbi:MAG: asparagine synthase (glutamine-hydrolyzing) [Anaerolineaceae bacterium]|nr:asparagine synthase (glutamine-hydrolyzing) [Anaerolineaceae bacterium]
MCGICGFVSNQKFDEDRFSLLNSLNQTLDHRGPDSDGFYINGDVGMGMRRLAIIDIASGDQPIFNEDKSIAIVYNGEIYNFQELRGQLERYDHIFSTNSDTEVIIHAYEQWGDECLLKFNGMFAFSLWDDKQKRLLIARDRMGQKPLYWHYSPMGLLWASEAKSLLKAPWLQPNINKLALHHYLTLQYTPDPLTIYDEIYQLPAAHKLVLEDGQKPVISRWWQLAFEPKWQIDDREAIVHARELLKAGVRRRLISEVPLGAFLSGGIDSSIIVALMSEESSFPVKSFSIGFEERHYSETEYAMQIAEKYGTDHHEFIFRPDDLTKVIEGVISATDEPFADPAALPLYELARQTRQHVTVALSGDGGDETLAGYRRYVLDRFLEPYANLPDWITQKAIPAGISYLPEPVWIPEDRNPLTGLKRLGQFSSTTEKASLVRWGSYFNHEDKLALYHDNWKEELSGEYTEKLLAMAYDQANADNLLDRTLYTDQVTYLSGDLLPKTDRMTMAHSIEARAPFLDADWVEWTARLPEKYKVRGMQTKWLLKNGFSEEIPANIRARGKQGFSIPVGQWLRNELREWSQEILMDNQSLSEIIKPQAIENLYMEHQAGRVNNGKKLWALLMLALWNKKY